MLRTDEQDVGVIEARRVRVRGTVQGVGFRPFVYRLARRFSLVGWVRNGLDGVEIHAEGVPVELAGFLDALRVEAPPAAHIEEVEAAAVPVEGHAGFEIVESGRGDRPTAHISPDLPICDACLADLRDEGDRRRGYPYVNCTNCGPRYSIIQRLPYDRAHTTMAGWAMCAACASEYADPLDRRYHAQPNACPECGPRYRWIPADELPADVLRAADSPDAEFSAAGLSAGFRGDAGPVHRSDGFTAAARELKRGEICAIKGLGGYHLSCDAKNPNAVRALRERKFRKEKPFAVMVRDLVVARDIVALAEADEELLCSPARPIVLMPARVQLEGVAPGNRDLGVMLPYAPLHALLFSAGAPDVLVMTSGNRSSEPIAYREEDAFVRLRGLADGFLVGERPITRRVDDSVVRAGPLGPVILRRSRGYAPAPVARLPIDRPVLALGADLKNSITLVVDGEAFVSQHIGDLAHLDAMEAFAATVHDLLAMYQVPIGHLLVVHDAHPQYASTRWAGELGVERLAVQHHRAHAASVAAEHDALDRRVVALALDGVGYGDDGTIWGGEVFVGSVREGFRRVAHLHPAPLPGGDAAAKHPVQAAAGFLWDVGGHDFTERPFDFPERYAQARRLLERDVRTFTTTSVGRLFDAAAALLGFTRAVTYEGQAAIWLEQLALRSAVAEPYPFPDLNYRPLLEAAIDDVVRGRRREDVARAFHLGLADGFAASAWRHAKAHDIQVIALSGGVFQNRLLTERIVQRLQAQGFEVWMNSAVPPNDGGISLGQAAIAAFHPPHPSESNQENG